MRLHPKWKDVTSYSNPNNSGQSKFWFLDLGPLQMSVHPHPCFVPEVWVCSCPALGLDERALTAADSVSARVQAQTLVAALLAQADQELRVAA